MPGPALELVPDRALLRGAGDPAPEAGEQALVGLAADRAELHRATVLAVEPDRRHGLAGDRQLDLEVPDRRQELRLGRHAARDRRRRRSSWRPARASSEPNAVRIRVTSARAATIPMTARRRARCCARCRRARCRAARRERGVAIGATVADVSPLLNGRRPGRLCRPMSRGYDPAHDRAFRARRSGCRAGSSSSACPVGLLIVWMLAGMLGHVLFLFLTAAVIAFLLNPLVRDLQRLRLPRGRRGGARLPPLRHRGRVRRARARQRRRRPDPLGDRPDRRLRHGRRATAARPAPSRTSTGSSSGSTPTASSASRSRSRRPTGPTTSAPARSRSTPRTRSRSPRARRSRSS